MVTRKRPPAGQRSQWWWARGIRCSVHDGVAHLVRVRWSGYPIACSQVAVEMAEPVGSRAAIDGEAELMLRRKADLKVAGVESSPLSDPQAQQRWPGLWDHLTLTAWPDGTKREPSSLLVFMQDGSLKGMLRDKDQGLCLWMASKSLLGLLSALEGAIDDPETDWREDRAPGGGTAKRTKR